MNSFAEDLKQASIEGTTKAPVDALVALRDDKEIEEAFFSWLDSEEAINDLLDNITKVASSGSQYIKLVGFSMVLNYINATVKDTELALEKRHYEEVLSNIDVKKLQTAYLEMIDKNTELLKSKEYGFSIWEYFLDANNENVDNVSDVAGMSEHIIFWDTTIEMEIVKQIIDTGNQVRKL